MRVALWPDTDIKGGWDSSFYVADFFDVVDLPFDTDVHAAPTTILGDRSPRITYDIAKEAEEEHGAAMSGAFIDLDTSPHVPWPSQSVAEATIEHVLEACHAANLWPVAYSTKQGMRLVFPFVEPVALSKAKAAHAWVFDQVADVLKATAVNMVPDIRTRGQWWRAYRMPLVRRDGADYVSSLYHDDVAPLRVPALDDAETLRPPRARVHDLKTPTSLPAHWPMMLSRASIAGQYKEELVARAALNLPVGDRNTTLLSIVRSISAQLCEVVTDPAEMVGALYWICAGSVAADDRPGSPTLEELRSMAERTAGLDVIETPPDVTQTKLPAWAVSNEVAPGEGEDGEFFDGEGLPTDTRPMVVVHPVQSSFWIRVEDDWIGPYGSTQVASKFGSIYPELNHTTKSGAPLPGPHIQYYYGAVAESVRYSHGASSFENGELNIQLYAKRRPITPRVHQDVAKWFELMAEGCPGFIEWWTWVGDLSAPLPALLIQGRHSIGKGLISQALTEYFGGSYTSWADLIQSAHGLAGLLRSPLIYADEMSGFNNLRETSVFRSVVGNTVHQVNEKNQPIATLHTATRFIAAANNEHALAINGRHSQEDLEAIRQRVLTCVPGEAPANYLASIGGRGGGTADWVTTADGRPGRLIEHIAWLQTQRAPTWAGRWPVAPWTHPTLARGSITGNHDEMTLWHVIAIALQDNRERVATIRTPNEILVSPVALATAWQVLAAKAGASTVVPPSPAAIASTLRAHKLRDNQRVRFGTSERLYMVPLPITPVLIVCESMGVETEWLLDRAARGNTTPFGGEDGEEAALARKVRKAREPAT